uniref:Gag-pol polyprotein n=1 Tax=Solanum tuberosum TaxID=4113 RepID=M1DG41_SOLTU
MNPPEFLGSQIGEDPQNLIDEVKKIFRVMQVTCNDRVELASYQHKDVTHIWNAMLLENMNISRLMTYAQQVEGDKLRENAKENKKARIGKYEYSQQISGGGAVSAKVFSFNTFIS